MMCQQTAKIPENDHVNSDLQGSSRKNSILQPDTTPIIAFPRGIDQIHHPASAMDL
jgi:hypothetical protein